MTSNRLRRSRLLVAVLGVGALVMAACGSGESDAPAPSSESWTHTESADEPPAAGPVYVNLGDSFSSGAGVQPLAAHAQIQCLRTSLNFAHLIAEQRNYALTDASCAGADTDDFYSEQHLGVEPQLDVLDEAGPDVQLVTVMIGGNNNATFGNTIRLCGEAAQADPQGSPCRDQHGDSLIAPIRDATYPAVLQVLEQVRERAPQAEIRLIGYPQLLPDGQGCYPRVGVAAGDVSYVRELEATLNDTLRRAAEATDVPFVDMSEVSEGHDACAERGVRWVEPQVDADTSVPLHPNPGGLAAMAEQILATLN